MLKLKASPVVVPVTTTRGDRLKEAVDAAVADSVTSVTEIAAECVNPATGKKGISTKAVYGWFSTGRISKENLFTVQRLTEYSSEYIANGVGPKKINAAGRAQPEGSPRAQVLASMYDAKDPEEKRQLWPRLLRLLTGKRRGSDEVREDVAQGFLHVLDEMGPTTLARLLSNHAIELEKQKKLDAGKAPKRPRGRKRS